jgi:hypothetical protein
MRAARRNLKLALLCKTEMKKKKREYILNLVLCFCALSSSNFSTLLLDENNIQLFFFHFILYDF